MTFLAALIGIASASYGGFDVANLPAIVTVVFALVAHAGINVLNDYYDELNGTDRINTERILAGCGYADRPHRNLCLILTIAPALTSTVSR